MKIILGSGSAGRKQVLTEMGYSFEVVPPDIDEKQIRHTDPRQLTMMIAEAKARVLLEKVQEPAIIITADQVVAWNGEIREKPVDEVQARYFLENCAGHPEEIVNSVVLTNTVTGQQEKGLDVPRLYFRTIPEALITVLIKEPKTYTYAGGFTISDPRLAPYIERVEGEKESIMGLPRTLTDRLIKAVMAGSAEGL
jgi:septum formation protein